MPRVAAGCTLLARLGNVIRVARLRCSVERDGVPHVRIPLNTGNLLVTTRRRRVDITAVVGRILTVCGRHKRGSRSGAPVDECRVADDVVAVDAVEENDRRITIPLFASRAGSGAVALTPRLTFLKLRDITDLIISVSRIISSDLAH